MGEEVKYIHQGEIARGEGQRMLEYSVVTTSTTVTQLATDTPVVDLRTTNNSRETANVNRTSILTWHIKIHKNE